MTYYQDLGLDLGELITKGGPAVQAASKVITDPALPEITCHVLRLNAIVEGRDPGPPCARKVYTAVEKHKGVGLSLATTPLRMIVWARKNPAIAIGAGVGVVGLIWYLGYLMGKKGKS